MDSVGVLLPMTVRCHTHLSVPHDWRWLGQAAFSTSQRHLAAFSPISRCNALKGMQQDRKGLNLEQQNRYVNATGQVVFVGSELCNCRCRRPGIFVHCVPLRLPRARSTPQPTSDLYIEFDCYEMSQCTCWPFLRFGTGDVRICHCVLHVFLIPRFPLVDSELS